MRRLPILDGRRQQKAESQGTSRMDEPTCLGSGKHSQSDLFEVESPATAWAAEAAKHALDDLFTATLAYRKSDAYFKLMKFVAHFRFYSPYNAMLLHVQRPGASTWHPHIAGSETLSDW